MRFYLIVQVLFFFVLCLDVSLSPALGEKRKEIADRINRVEALLHSLKSKSNITTTRQHEGKRHLEFDTKGELSRDLPEFRSASTLPENRLQELSNRIDRADSFLKAIMAKNSLGEGNEYLAVETDEFSDQTHSPPVFPLLTDQNVNEADSNEQMKTEGNIEKTEEQVPQMFFVSRSTSTPHQLNFQFSYLSPFNSTFKTVNGEGVPLEYESGWQGEIQYLYRFPSFFLGSSIFWSEQGHKRIGPLQYSDYLDASGQTRSFGGALLTGVSLGIGQRFSIESILSLGLARRLDDFQLQRFYFSEAGTVFLYSLGLGAKFQVTDKFCLGLWGKFQNMNALYRNTSSQTFLFGTSVGMRF